MKANNPKDPLKPLYGDKHGDNQKFIQMIIMAVAVLCIPVMLLVKPLVLNSRNKKDFHSINQAENHENRPQVNNLGLNSNQNNINDIEDDVKSNGDDHEEHGLGDLMMHQTIETIEFVLGSISNTASYLRLWALSLAHSQLSKVFYEKAVKGYLIGEAQWSTIYLQVIEVSYYF